MPTKQEIYDEAVDYEGLCIYRGDYDRKCAVGCLIPDHIYDEAMEGQGIGSLLAKDSFEDELDFLRPHLHLLEYLQKCHDATFTWSNDASFKESFRGPAITFKLDSSILDRLDFSHWKKA